MLVSNSALSKDEHLCACELFDTVFSDKYTCLNGILQRFACWLAGCLLDAMPVFLFYQNI